MTSDWRAGFAQPMLCTEQKSSGDLTLLSSPLNYFCITILALISPSRFFYSFPRVTMAGGQSLLQQTHQGQCDTMGFYGSCVYLRGPHDVSENRNAPISFCLLCKIMAL